MLGTLTSLPRWKVFFQLERVKIEVWEDLDIEVPTTADPSSDPGTPWGPLDVDPSSVSPQSVSHKGEEHELQKF